MIKVYKGDITKDFTNDQYKKLFSQIDNVLSKRKTLYEKYSRGSDDKTTLFDNNSLKIPFEKFIVDLATGYLAGEPKYDVDVPSELDVAVRSKIFGKEVISEEIINEMKSILDYVSLYNDDHSEVFNLLHDLVLYGACYEVLYENDNNEIIYHKLDAINTVAIYDTAIPANLVAIISKYSDKDVDGNEISKYRIVDTQGIRVFDQGSDKEVKEDTSMKEVKVWGDVPGFAVETDFSIIENSEAVIETYESLLSNVKDTYKYNAEDCKMKISGYKAQNRLMVKDEKSGQMIINPDRIKEDEYVLSTRTFYTEEGGDADWLVKPVDAGGVTTLLKYYVDMIFQLAGIPNTSDLAFNSADLNASAIDRKFYVMDMKTQDLVALLKKGLLRRFELIFGRINLKASTKYDFRYIKIDIPKNLPSMTDETIEQMIKLNGILSEQTVIEQLGYDYETEKLRKEDDLSERNNMDNPEQDDEEPIDEDGDKSEDSNSEPGEGNEESEEKSTSDKDGKDRGSEV